MGARSGEVYLQVDLLGYRLIPILIVLGLSGNDALAGKQDNDLLMGGQSDDTLLGDKGDDVVEGNEGLDDCNGGPHVDGDQADISCEAIRMTP